MEAAPTGKAGGGAQLQVVRQGLWLRTEGTMSRNADLLTQTFVPRESLSLGFNGYVTSRTSVGVDVYLDRGATVIAGGEPVGDAIAGARDPDAANRFGVLAGGSGLFRSVPVRAVATVKGMVYADWNGNGLQDPGENPGRRRAVATRGRRSG